MVTKSTRNANTPFAQFFKTGETKAGTSAGKTGVSAEGFKRKLDLLNSI